MHLLTQRDDNPFPLLLLTLSAEPSVYHRVDSQTGWVVRGQVVPRVTVHNGMLKACIFLEVGPLEVFVWIFLTCSPHSLLKGSVAS